MAPPDITAYDFQYDGDAKKTPRIILTQFGEGYPHRAKDGINTLDVIWPVTFGPMYLTQSNVLEAALEVGTWEGLFWRAPTDTVTKKWLVIGGYSLKLHGRNNDSLGESMTTITTTFKLLYEP